MPAPSHSTGVAVLTLIKLSDFQVHVVTVALSTKWPVSSLA